MLGHDVGETEYREQIGFAPESPYFYDFLTGREILRLLCAALRRPASAPARARRHVLDLVGLAQAADARLRTYSKGMLQRIGIAQALVHDPSVVFLDEPMSGLDPIGRKEIRDLIVRLHAEGKTVFMNTHILSDVEMLCDRVAIIVQGASLTRATLDAVLAGGERAVRGDVLVARTRVRGGSRGALRGALSGRGDRIDAASSAQARGRAVAGRRSLAARALEELAPVRAGSRRCSSTRSPAASRGKAMRWVSAVLAIAGNTVREAIRSKVLYVLLFFALVLIATSASLATLSYVERERILQDVGFARDPLLRRRDRDLRRRRPRPPRGRPPHDLHDPLEAGARAARSSRASTSAWSRTLWLQLAVMVGVLRRRLVAGGRAARTAARDRARADRARARGRRRVRDALLLVHDAVARGAVTASASTWSAT